MLEWWTLLSRQLMMFIFQRVQSHNKWVLKLHLELLCCLVMFHKLFKTCFESHTLCNSSYPAFSNLSLELLKSCKIISLVQEKNRFSHFWQLPGSRKEGKHLGQKESRRKKSYTHISLWTLRFKVAFLLIKYMKSTTFPGLSFYFFLLGGSHCSSRIRVLWARVLCGERILLVFFWS